MFAAGAGQGGGDADAQDPPTASAPRGKNTAGETVCGLKSQSQIEDQHCPVDEFLRMQTVGAGRREEAPLTGVRKGIRSNASPSKGSGINTGTQGEPDTEAIKGVAFIWAVDPLVMSGHGSGKSLQMQRIWGGGLQRKTVLKQSSKSFKTMYL